jgi:murein DD-endopeptidase MepM/ murein hydrolase activator NlpD
MLRHWAILVTAAWFFAFAEPGPAAHADAARAAFVTTPGSTPEGSVEARCGASLLRDHGVCVHLEEEQGENPLAVAIANQHVERGVGLRTYDQIPRRPDRPESYSAYLFPLSNPTRVMSGYDLDLPDSNQRRAPTLRHTGHGGLDLTAARGAPVTVVLLEHESQEPEVLYAGGLFGTSVVTLHTVHEGGDVREYVVIYGHLDEIAAGIQAGRHLAPKEVVGFVGDTGSPGLVHLHLEIRRVRESAKIRDAVRQAGGGAILLDWATVVTDPRNLLPLTREYR